MDAPCDECGVPASDSARVEFDDVVIQTNLCAEHLEMLLEGARPLFPARRP